ncbi:hypothetical protein E1B28_000729 [Marasmius oreades]|uniref:lytic cellulose monooxygenase (C4-dehydrogenating) n=1 Tax=Marasmius oreades TaxID=181124 RepID=A0A9P7V224_9AGAR|nr:uncharacterized protein E1B28_000729 [Marasmius oreades]KAG7098825.1 hypothetical protein E1B28_000729 [Marasmius oreades]
MLGTVVHSFSIVAVVILCLFASIPPVLAHGFVHTVTIGGQEYPGWNPFSDPYLTPPPSRVIRRVQSDGFVSIDDPDLPCHHDGNTGNDTAVIEVNAGSTVAFQWGYWPSDHQGPVSTYMTFCNGDCRSFSVTGAKWFKLDAGGYDTETKLWASDKLRMDNNSWKSTIPASLSPGQYLIRNEIIALHSITPQNYPSCGQLNVKGSGKGFPSDRDLVSIPGLYDNVAFPNIYSDFGSFTIPGPPPVSLDNSNPPFTVTSTPSPTVVHAGTTTPSGGDRPLNHDARVGHCRLTSRRRTR